MIIIFRISSQDVYNSSTLEKSDINKWAYLINGSYQIFNSQHEAIVSFNEVFDKSKNNN